MLPCGTEVAHRRGVELMRRLWGFGVVTRTSRLSGAGRGVFVVGSPQDDSVVRIGDLTCLYPGTFYSPGDPILIPSIANPFVFRCADGLLLDGNGKGLSGAIFRSLLHRDSEPTSGFVAADATWTKDAPANPLSVGQIVNNAGGCQGDDDNEAEANVAYHELQLRCPEDIPREYLQHLPYLRYSSPPSTASSSSSELPIKLVVLLALRDIRAGEELYSDYFSVVN